MHLWLDDVAQNNVLCLFRWTQFDPLFPFPRLHHLSSSSAAEHMKFQQLSPKKGLTPPLDALYRCSHKDLHNGNGTCRLQAPDVSTVQLQYYEALRL